MDVGCSRLEGSHLARLNHEARVRVVTFVVVVDFVCDEVEDAEVVEPDEDASAGLACACAGAVDAAAGAFCRTRPKIEAAAAMDAAITATLAPVFFFI